MTPVEYERTLARVKKEKDNEFYNYKITKLKEFHKRLERCASNGVEFSSLQFTYVSLTYSEEDVTEDLVLRNAEVQQFIIEDLVSKGWVVNDIENISFTLSKK